MKRPNEGLHTESNFWEFIRTMNKAKAAGARTFKCPVCGSEAYWGRNEYNGHIHAECSGCRMSLAQ